MNTKVSICFRDNKYPHHAVQSDGYKMTSQFILATNMHFDELLYSIPVNMTVLSPERVFIILLLFHILIYDCCFRLTST